MEEARCIYCNTSKQLGESDIIPDALTNARITNKNVCRIAHNNKFSNLFESKVISELGFISNTLNVKSSKAKNYSAYPAQVEIDEKKYDIETRSENDIFNGRLIKTTNGKTAFTSYDKALKIAKDPNEVTCLDVDRLVLKTSVNISLNIFFDKAMYRMIAKIAYEWYCAINKISGCHIEFADIVEFITTGKGNNPVTLIQEKTLYKQISKEANSGSHCLFGFCDSRGQVNVVVFLFGIALYRVVVAAQTPSYAVNNFLFQELRVDSIKREVCEISLGEAKKKLQSFFDNASPTDIHTVSGKNVVVCDKKIFLYMFLIKTVYFLANGAFCEDTVANKQISSILYHYIDSITQVLFFNKKSLGRFVDDYVKDEHKPIKINPNSVNLKVSFQFYILMKIGELDAKEIDNEILSSIVNKAAKADINNELTINDKLIESLKKEMLAKENYSNLIECGATIVKAWK